ncbi:MAG: SpoIIE family protein phosphatase [Clostridiales bacterium]|jgi:sigma-B regulation protein RsbU (phosphoserine phosphatase)|nr:SpoIIE family protein phosphatase [Clostridiales bacterium]
MPAREEKRRGMGLRGKFAVGIMILGAALMTAMLTLTYALYRNASLEKYRHIVAAAAQSAAQLVDGDDARRYLDTGEPDAQYYATAALLQGILDYSELTYLYVYLPRWEEGYCEFVFDAEQRAEAAPAAPGAGAAAAGGTGAGGAGSRAAGSDAAAPGAGMDDAAPASALGTRMEILGPEQDSSVTAVRQVADTLRPNLELNLSHSQYGSLVSAFCPLLDSRGELAAIVGADVDVRHVFAEVNRIALLTGAIIALLVALAISLFQMYFARTMIRPIRALAAHAQNFSRRRNEQGRLYLEPIRISTRDEIEDLAEAFAQTARDIIQHVDDVTRLTDERRRLEAEMGVAARIQASVLSHDFGIAPNPGDFCLFAMMDPAREVGGDFYDFFMLDGRRLALIVGDVSGKGVPAALFMMMSKSIIRARLGRGAPLAQAFAEANSLLCQNNGEDMFVTVLCALLDIETGELAIADAGHGPPVLIGPDGAARKLETKPSLFMGAMDGVAYAATGGRMSPGDRLLLYTDGVNEAMDSDGRFFGEDGLMASIRAHGGDAGVASLLARVREDIRAFAGAAPQSDDITMLAVRYRGGGEAAGAGDAASGGGGAGAGGAGQSDSGGEATVAGDGAGDKADSGAGDGEGEMDAAGETGVADETDAADDKAGSGERARESEAAPCA